MGEPGCYDKIASMVDKSTFRARLIQAAERVIPFTQIYVIDALPSMYRYRIFPNCSYDGRPRVGDEEVFPEDSEGVPATGLGPWGPEEVVEYLWRDGKIPEWINVHVYSYDDEYTYVALTCCGRFTARDDLLYSLWTDVPPFRVCGPSLPPNWKSIEESPKFKLHWHGPPVDEAL